MSAADDPSQPTVYEMIRTLSRQMDQQAQATARLEGICSGMVTQEQRRSDAELSALRHGQLAEAVARAEERGTWARRASATALGAPVVVAVLLWLMGASVSVPTA